MKYVITNLSYDFGQKRVSAGLQSTEGGYPSFVNINIGFEPPVDVSAQDLERIMVDYIRSTLVEAAEFTLK